MPVSIPYRQARYVGSMKSCFCLSAVSIPYRQARYCAKYSTISEKFLGFNSLQVGQILGGRISSRNFISVSIPYRQARYTAKQLKRLMDNPVSIPYRQARYPFSKGKRKCNILSFNSLQVGQIQTWIYIENMGLEMFQFLIGRLDTQQIQAGRSVLQKFQFLIGRLDTDWFKEVKT